MDQKKKKIKSNFNVQSLDIYGEKDEEDISNYWIKRERERISNNQLLVVRRKV